MDNALMFFAWIVNIAAVLQMILVQISVFKFERDFKIYVTIIWGIVLILGTGILYMIIANNTLKETMNKHGLYEVVVPVETVIRNEVRWEFK
jgi:hypothetical protein